MQLIKWNHLPSSWCMTKSVCLADPWAYRSARQFRHPFLSLVSHLVLESGNRNPCLLMPRLSEDACMYHASTTATPPQDQPPCHRPKTNKPSAHDFTWHLSVNNWLPMNYLWLHILCLVVDVLCLFWYGHHYANSQTNIDIKSPIIW